MSNQRRFATLACVAALLALARPSLAHSGLHSYCNVHEVTGGLQVELDVPAQLLAQRSQPLLDLEGHVRATTPNGECTPAARGPAPGPRPDRRRIELDFSCPDGPVTFSTDYGLDVDRTAEIVCAIDDRAHVFREGALDYLVGTPPSLQQQLASFVRLGALHVFGGLDHVLFVLSLLLGAAGAAARAPRVALRRMVGIVSGFTLGHSVTLTIAALGIFALPAALTESLIALSIVTIALQNLCDANPRGRVGVSALFGLVHGFGFASALVAIGLPRNRTVPTLLAFNVGIELAQLALLLACFPLLVWASRRAWFRGRLLVPACCVIAGLAAVWFAKRAFGLSLWPWLGS